MKPPASSHFGSDPLAGVAEGGVRVDARHHRAVLLAHLSVCILYFVKVSAQMLLFAYLYLVFLQCICSDALLFLILYLYHLLCAAIPLLDVPFERCQHALLSDASSITIINLDLESCCVQSIISQNHK